MIIKQRLMKSSLLVMAFAVLGGTQIAAAAKLNETGLETLGISAETYEAAVDDAAVAYNNELVAMGWVTQAEADEESADGDWVRLGRGTYYAGILEKDVFIADALGISMSELDAAEDASQAAHTAEHIAEGDITEAEAADKAALQAFKESIDKDSVLAQAMGITVADLDAARSQNVEYSDLLDELGLTSQEVREAQQAIYDQLIADAVADGTLSAEQAEQANQRNGRNGRGNRGGGNGDGEGDADGQTQTQNPGQAGQGQGRGRGGNGAPAGETTDA